MERLTTCPVVLGKRHNAAVPKRHQIAVPTPTSVYLATQAFGSELRMHLIRYYGATPSRQADAVRALGVERPVIQFNTNALVELGVLVRHPDRSYAVDQAHVDELFHSLQIFCRQRPDGDDLPGAGDLR